MPRLEPLSRETVPELADTLARSEERMGFVPNSQLMMARRPEILRGFAQLAGAINGPSSTISPQLRNLVSQMASRTSGCGYCMAHTAHTAGRVGVPDAKEEALWEYETSPLFSVAERAALRRAEAPLQRRTDRRHCRGHRIIRVPQPLQRHDGDRARILAARSGPALSRRAGLDRRQARALTENSF